MPNHLFEGALEQRMMVAVQVGRCVYRSNGGIVETDANGVNDLAKNYQTIYPIASRCGVFDKTDVQPLINEGADKADIARQYFSSSGQSDDCRVSCWS